MDFESEDVLVSSDPSLLDLALIHSFLKRTNWAAKRTRETLEKSVKNSVCFGAYVGNRQIAFARVVTDGCTFGYLCDVFVDEAYRGRGISKRLVEAVMAHPELQSYRRFVLATQNAHGLYAKFGFTEVKPGQFMEIKVDGI